MSRECVRCGNCCPDTCPDKKRSDDNIVTCLRHPSIVGQETRGSMCVAGPEYYYFYCKIACQAMYPLSLVPDLKVEKLPNGQVVLVK